MEMWRVEGEKRGKGSSGPRYGLLQRSCATAVTLATERVLLRSAGAAAGEPTQGRMRACNGLQGCITRFKTREKPIFLVPEA